MRKVRFGTWLEASYLLITMVSIEGVSMGKCVMAISGEEGRFTPVWSDVDAATSSKCSKRDCGAMNLVAKYLLQRLTETNARIYGSLKPCYRRRTAVIAVIAVSSEEWRSTNVIATSAPVW